MPDEDLKFKTCIVEAYLLVTDEPKSIDPKSLKLYSVSKFKKNKATVNLRTTGPLDNIDSADVQTSSFETHCDFIFLP